MYLGTVIGCYVSSSWILKKSNFNSFNYVETCIELLYLRGNYVTLYVSSTITTSIPLFRIYPLHPEYYGVYLQEDMLIYA